MVESLKIVIHYMDGTIVKGTTQDFAANRPLFHLTPNGLTEPINVVTQELKAVYFVKDFEGAPKRRDAHGFGAVDSFNQGKKIAVLFKDGELLCGTTLSYIPGRLGFFVLPADSGSNNLRIYVISASTVEVKAGPAAEHLVRKAS